MLEILANIALFSAIIYGLIWISTGLAFWALLKIVLDMRPRFWYSKSQSTERNKNEDGRTGRS